MAEAPQKTPVKSEETAIERAPAEWSPLANLRREFDRMLEDFPWRLAPACWPAARSTSSRSCVGSPA